MKFSINFSPVFSEEKMPLVVARGSALVIDGTAFDFGFLDDGDTLPRDAIGSSHFAGDVSRSVDTIALTLRLPHGLDAPESVRFPQLILVTQDGPIALPGDAHAD